MCQVNRKNRSFFYTNIDGNVYNVVCSRHRVIQKKCPAGKFNTAQTMKVQCRKKKTPKKSPHRQKNAHKSRIHGWGQKAEDNPRIQTRLANRNQAILAHKDQSGR